MWVSKQAYQLIEKQIDRLEKEVEYWKGKFEESLNRADRLGDLITSQLGNRPVSDLGIAEVDKQKAEYLKMFEETKRQTQEMFSEGEGSGNGELEIDPDLAQSLIGAFN